LGEIAEQRSDVGGILRASTQPGDCPTPATMKNENDRPASSPDEVLNELRALLAEAEKVLAEAKTEGHGDEADDIRRRFEAAQERLTNLVEEARRKVTDGLKSADETIREHPYQAVAIALGLGMLLGILLGRRSK
jgi:ElaB/YqjD/DUF883 family membrane-anchored ribosome-binding protein